MLSPYKSVSNFATLQSNIFALFGRITFKLGKLSYSKALFPAVLIRDIRSLLFIKVVRNRGSIYYTNSRSRERKKNDIEKTAKQGSTTVSALIIFYSFCQNKLLRESSLVRKFVTPKVSKQTSAWSGQVSPGTKGLLFER